MSTHGPIESESQNAPAIAISHLSKSFGDVQAVRDLTLEVEPGQVFGFLGLNGAGKTTTIRVLLDLLRPTAGVARVFGIDCQIESRRVRSMIGYLPGELGLYPDMTGEETLTLMARLSGSRVSPGYRRQLLDGIELGNGDLRRRIREYSTGMKRKLGIVQALQADPPLLILDEPTEGLDPLVQRALNEILFDLRDRGRTVFMSSHVLSEVETVCDRIGVIRNGELVLLSTIAEVRALGGRNVRIHFERPVQLPKLPEGTSVVEISDLLWHLRLQGELGELLRLLRDLPVRDLEVIEPALEDVLKSFYREDSA